MLFSVKKNALLSIALALVFASASILVKQRLGLDWNLYIGRGTVEQLFTGLGFILASDLIISILLLVIFHTSFVRLWMEMAAYFSPQSLPAVLGGGLLAAGEEMFFRGVMLQYMIQKLNVTSYYAVGVSAAVFALLHILRNKRLALFSLWAFWEGVVLGAVYLYTDSLPVAMAVHAAHDIAGFALFSLQRKRGVLPVITKR